MSRFARTASAWYDRPDWSTTGIDDAREVFTLNRTQREDMWRRYKQTDDRRIAERLHAILLLDSGHNADAVSAILHIHPKTLKRWIKAFVVGGEVALTNFNYVGCDGWITNEQQQQWGLFPRRP